MAVATITMGTAASIFGYEAFSGDSPLYGQLMVVLFFVWTAMTVFMLVIDFVLCINCLKNIHRRRQESGDIPLQPEQRPLFKDPPS